MTSCSSRITQNTIQNLFPLLNQPELLDEISKHGMKKSFNQGEFIIKKGQYIHHTPLVLFGSIRVTREEKGHEILLYLLEKGDTCAMTISCCMKQEKSEIWATAEVDTEVLLIPTSISKSWMKRYESWQRFIISSYANRMEALLKTVDSIAFFRLDERLLKYLQDRSKALETKTFSITHNDIAIALNASREAISRLLKKLEKMGKVELQRNTIKLL